MMTSSAGRVGVATLAGTLLAVTVCTVAGQPPPRSDRARILDTMKRATVFMVEKVSTEGGYVWSYLPDLSRRWGELEARDTMVWIQPPGTPAMGHLFLDACHATGDQYYCRAAERAAGALMLAQLPSGGWNYVADFAGEAALQQWYDTVGRNAWRLEEFQHHWRNGTFDDAGTAESAKLLLRLYLEKRDPTFKAALDKAIAFVLDSQYPIGGWPQRYPLKSEFSRGGLPDYTSFITFNDDVAGENIDFLVMCYQALGDPRLLDPIRRGMDAFLQMQQPPPQAGWALQYTPDLKPAGARTYEPKALVTHTTAANIDLLIRFYRLTGDPRYLARIPDALGWLNSVALPPGVAPEGRTHPTFVEIGTNTPLYVHREGSNVFNGRYYVDGNPRNTIGHYSSFRRIDTAGLERRYEEARALSPAALAKKSPLAPGAVPAPLPALFTGNPAATTSPTVEDTLSSLDPQGRWLGPLGTNSHPYRGDGSTTRPDGNFSETMVGDGTDTSPYPDATVQGLSTAAFIGNMSVLIRALGGLGDRPAVGAPAPVVWTLDSLSAIGGHQVRATGTPRVVTTELGPAVEFDGVDDGLFLDVNPLEGLARFTVEVLFQPDAGGGVEQRFLHVEEAGTENRALVELRRLPDSSWTLDTFLLHGNASLTLVDRSQAHPANRWHTAALAFDGQTMAHWVDGVREASGAVAFRPLGAGRTSIGVRQNRVSWFKGRIREIRITPGAVPPDRMLQAPCASGISSAGRRP
jgi:PelA/Pel-15E family pectate lyase